jgi:anti-sigma B factor antagonist
MSGAGTGLRWTVDDGGAEVIVAVAGELDMGRTDALQTELVEAASSGKNVVLDMGDLTFIDSAGIRCLLIAREAASERAVMFTLRRPSSMVLRVLEITGTRDLFAVDAD